MCVSDFAALGYRAVLFPVSTLRAAARAVDRLLGELKLFGTQRDWLDHMMPRQELYDRFSMTISNHRPGGSMNQVTGTPSNH